MSKNRNKDFGVEGLWVGECEFIIRTKVEVKLFCDEIE